MTVSMWGEAVFLCLSVVFGVGLGVLSELLGIAFSVLGLLPRDTARFLALSARPLPLIGKGLFGRLRRRGRRVTAVLTFGKDVLRWTVSAVAYSVFLYACHDGIFRIYSLLGVIFGFWVYYHSVGRLSALVFDYLLYGLGIAVSYLLFFLSYPLLLLWRLVRGYTRRIRRTVPPFSAAEGAGVVRPVPFGLLAYLLGRVCLGIHGRQARLSRHRRLTVRHGERKK